MSKDFKVTDVKVSQNWIYDTFKGRLTVSAKINGHKVNFPFTACRCGDIMFTGIDCNEAIFEDGRTSVSYGGTQTSYELRIPVDVLKAKPKENQKDFRFTGRYYSTQPIKAEFKRKLLEMLYTYNVSNDFAKKILK